MFMLCRKSKILTVAILICLCTTSWREGKGQEIRASFHPQIHTSMNGKYRVLCSALIVDHIKKTRFMQQRTYRLLESLSYAEINKTWYFNSGRLTYDGQSPREIRVDNNGKYITTFFATGHNAYSTLGLDRTKPSIIVYDFESLNIVYSQLHSELIKYVAGNRFSDVSELLNTHPMIKSMSKQSVKEWLGQYNHKMHTDDCHFGFFFLSHDGDVYIIDVIGIVYELKIESGNWKRYYLNDNALNVLKKHDSLFPKNSRNKHQSLEYVPMKKTNKKYRLLSSVVSSDIVKELQSNDRGSVIMGLHDFANCGFPEATVKIKKEIVKLKQQSNNEIKQFIEIALEIQK